MKSGNRWVIIDTETDGLCAPIHVVEICGQLMEGWTPIGTPFRMLLNHDVPIPWEASGHSRIQRANTCGLMERSRNASMNCSGRM